MSSYNPRRRMKRTLAAVGATTVACAVSIPLTSTAFAQGSSDEAVEVLGTDSPGTVSNSYIAVFDEEAPKGKKKLSELAEGIVADKADDLDHLYHSSLRGFSFSGNESQAEEVAAHPDVDYVDTVREMESTDTTQSNPPNWGTDRLDQNDLPLDDAYSYPDNAGSGATVYVLDTGINPDHNEFGNRASMGPSFADEDDSTDCHGHGTHVSGTSVGSDYGVAKGADVVGVQVLGCDGYGSTDGIIAAIDWVTEYGDRPAVINMSLGGPSGGEDQAYQDSVSNAVANGVTVVAAAGNDGDDACNYTPAKFDNVITVANSNQNDARYTGYGTSNYGTCVDVFGPGTDILSAAHDSNTEVTSMTGTSMASPHVAGVVAVYLGENPNATPAQATSAVLDNATADTLTDVGTGSPNLMTNTEFMLEGGNDGGDGDDGSDNPDEPSDPSNCADYATTAEGTLSGSGDTAVHPDGSYYYAYSGTHEGCLDGADGTDFDLYLQKWNGSSWQTVISSTSADSQETVSYDGSSGYYRWVAYSYSGSGSYSFGYTQP
ncbi:S8 family peptidase [Haloglycomyces albus]|uniref:S8 family peptidase n=1 Tax=Haloglycomyces albus TaxID=526067 RepID=UPI000A064148|nr:S8 family peptidase [Haloglycomyces albus]